MDGTTASSRHSKKNLVQTADHSDFLKTVGCPEYISQLMKTTIYEDSILDNQARNAGFFSPMFVTLEICWSESL